MKAAFEVANVFCVFLCVPLLLFVMLIYRMVSACQVQNIILRQGMSDILTV